MVASFGGFFLLGEEFSFLFFSIVTGAVAKLFLPLPLKLIFKSSSFAEMKLSSFFCRSILVPQEVRIHLS